MRVSVTGGAVAGETGLRTVGIIYDVSNSKAMEPSSSVFSIQATKKPRNNPRNNRQQGQSVNRYAVSRAVQCSSLWHHRGTNTVDAQASELESQLSSHSTCEPG